MTTLDIQQSLTLRPVGLWRLDFFSLLTSNFLHLVTMLAPEIF